MIFKSRMPTYPRNIIILSKGRCIMLPRCIRQLLSTASLLGLALAYSSAQASSEDIVDIATSDAPIKTTINKAKNLALAATNIKIDTLEQKALDNKWSHLDLSLGWDNGKPTFSIMSVYGLNETKNWFIFNQSSLVNYDDRNTVNLGFGARHINDKETVILGANAFYDYELDSGHSRSSLGIEALTSLVELRANSYSAQSGTITYNGINETALGGYDYSLKAQLPYAYSSNIYIKRTKWLDNIDYSSSIKEWGIEVEPVSNFKITLGSQQKNSADSKFVGTLTYRMPFGQTDTLAKQKHGGNWSNSLESVRYKLYKPVQRENRIAKKAIKLGLTVSGY